MTDATSSGDPAATLRLLWRDHLPEDTSPRRGPRRGLSIDTIVSAAIALADDDGLAALTMRRLADRLGVRPMSLYTYVPSRDELVDLMLDATYAAMPRPSLPESGWQERVRAVAESNKRLFERHPWAAELATQRPPLGPGQLAKYEYELAAFAGSGLDDVSTDDALTYLLGFVRGAARDIHSARATQRATGGDDQQWWDAVGPLLSQVLDPDAYPLASRIGTAAGEAHGSAHDTEHAYRFGLERTMNALERLAAGRAPE
ncbi:TetR/AcrR family transcriptional regulator [Microbacterium sp. SA39]|uniref:TetR/AcrR family transcriptional regulator n=1 Tax=Microbacterium sp. SA39 TaxID=1263625 RepID=UPI0005F9B195|nr:TetR/AcrR family transcriptional regulator [Microbacterium sp. SA39]KJQ55407.1 Tetracycline repressor protein class E [Microbacterium sp. SA39]